MGHSETLKALEQELAELQIEAQRLHDEYQAATLRVNRRVAAVRALQEIVAETASVGGGDAAGDVENEVEVDAGISETMGATPEGSVPSAFGPAAPTPHETNEVPSLKEGSQRITRRHTRGDILAVMRAEPRPMWSKQEITAEFVRRGWTTHMKRPEAAIGHAADRLKDDGLLVRPKPGHYALHEDVDLDAIIDAAMAEFKDSLSPMSPGEVSIGEPTVEPVEI
jgi:hypothetical protein